ncbi:MAG: hypothetical protein RL030_2310, partial [Pseudomonadota bacterium]
DIPATPASFLFRTIAPNAPPCTVDAA